MPKDSITHWMQGDRFTDGRNNYVLGEIWMRGFAKKRIIFVNSSTNQKYEYTAQQFRTAIEEGKIKKL